MRHIAPIVVLLLCSALVPSAQSAQVLYKSVGSDGRIVYSDRPPAEGRLEKSMTFENLPSSPLPASTSSYVDRIRSTRLPAATISPPTGVVLYAAAWCGFCKRAKAYLAAKGIKYQEFDVDTKDGMAAFARAGGGKGVPLLFAGGQRVQGFSPAAYNAVFAQ